MQKQKTGKPTEAPQHGHETKAVQPPDIQELLAASEAHLAQEQQQATNLKTCALCGEQTEFPCVPKAR